jgi:hypothetical protein
LERRSTISPSEHSGHFHTDGFLLHILALGIVAASCEFAVAAGLQYQVIAALGALLIERLVRFLLLAADGLGDLAVG